MTDALQQRRDRLKGIALVSLATVLFASLDTMNKFLTGSLDPIQISWGRYFFGFLLWLILLNPMAAVSMAKTSRPGLQIARGLLLTFGSITSTFAYRWIQLDQAAAILFGAPLVVALLSNVFLGDKFGWHRWGAIFVGFVGVLIVTKVGFGGIHPAGLLAVASMLGYSVYLVLTRVASHSDSNQTSLIYVNVVGTVVLSLALPFVWKTPETWLEIALMILVGVVGSSGHYLVIMGHKLAPAGVLAPFIYLQLVWVTVFGFIVFANLPDRYTIAGAAIVIASGLYLLYREHRVGRDMVSDSMVK